MAEARQEAQAGGPDRRRRPGRSYSFYTRVDGRQEAGQAGGGEAGGGRGRRRARPEAGEAGVTVFIQESMPGSRRQTGQEAGQAGGGPGRSYSFYTRVDARQEGQAEARQEGQAEARQEGQAEAADQAGGGPDRRRARQELQFLYKSRWRARQDGGRQQAVGSPAPAKYTLVYANCTVAGVLLAESVRDLRREQQPRLPASQVAMTLVAPALESASDHVLFRIRRQSPAYADQAEPCRRLTER